MTEQEAIRLLRIVLHRPSIRSIARAANIQQAHLGRCLKAGTLPRTYLERLKPVLRQLAQEAGDQNACSAWTKPRDADTMPERLSSPKMVA